VTPGMCTHRVWISITNKTYSRLRNTVSTCRKSHARIRDGLTGAAGFPERQWRLLGQRRGRVDLAVEVEGEQMLVIIEIKGTNWDLIPADRLLRNLRRHLHQL
jgi:hypothetical protein